MKLGTLVLPALFAVSAAYAAEPAMSGQTSGISPACKHDIQSYCSTATTDVDKNACLQTNVSKLSRSCQQALTNASGTNASAPGQTAPDATQPQTPDQTPPAQPTP